MRIFPAVLQRSNLYRGHSVVAFKAIVRYEGIYARFGFEETVIWFEFLLTGFTMMDFSRWI